MNIQGKLLSLPHQMKQSSAVDGALKKAINNGLFGKGKEVSQLSYKGTGFSGLVVRLKSFFSAAYREKVLDAFASKVEDSINTSLMERKGMSRDAVKRVATEIVNKHRGVIGEKRAESLLSEYETGVCDKLDYINGLDEGLRGDFFEALNVDSKHELRGALQLLHEKKADGFEKINGDNLDVHDLSAGQLKELVEAFKVETEARAELLANVDSELKKEFAFQLGSTQQKYTEPLRQQGIARKALEQKTSSELKADLPKFVGIEVGRAVAEEARNLSVQYGRAIGVGDLSLSASNAEELYGVGKLAELKETAIGEIREKTKSHVDYMIQNTHPGLMERIDGDSQLKGQWKAFQEDMQMARQLMYYQDEKMNDLSIKPESVGIQDLSKAKAAFKRMPNSVFNVKDLDFSELGSTAKLEGLFNAYIKSNS